MEYVIAGGTVIGLAALMSHGDSDDANWFEGTLKMVGVLLLLLTAGALIVWVATYGK